MTGLRYSPLHVTELCGEMQGNFKVGCARLIIHLSSERDNFTLHSNICNLILLFFSQRYVT